MENRRQKIYEWYLTRKGRVIGSFLCVLTFALMTVAFGLIAYSVSRFGSSILTEPDKNYYRTEYYENALKQDMKNLLQDAKKAYWDAGADKFSIECVDSYGLVHDYDMQLIREAYDKEEIPETLDELNIYEKYAGTDKRLMPGMFCYYNKAYAFIRSLRNKNAYIYITGDTMRELMIQRGYVNTDYRISNKFSEDAVFLFTDITQPGADPKKTATSSSDDGSYYSYSMVVQGGEKGSAATYSANRYPDLDKVGYLAYEPSTQTFYSPWNDYFKCEDEYVYRVDDLLATIAKNGVRIGNTDSMLFPMLWTESVTVTDAFNERVEKQIAREKAQADLDTMDKSFQFYIKYGNTLCKNVEKKEDIEALREHYEIIDGMSEGTDSIYHIAKLLKDQEMKQLLSELPSKVEIAIGVGYEGTTSAVGRGKALYTFYQRYELALEIGILFLFLFLVTQLVYLSRTAGKRKGQSVFGRLSDRIPTEIWMLLCIIILGIVAFDTKDVIAYVLVQEERQLYQVALITGMGGILCGTLFLLVWSSIIDRVRNKNLWSGSLIFQWRKGLRKHGWQLSGADRLFWAMVLYITCNVGLVLMYFLYRGHNAIVELLILICFLAVQVLAGIGMQRILQDSRKLLRGIEKIKDGELGEPVVVNERTRLFQEFADGVNHLSDGLQAAVETSLKDERMKTELITNVSHDLKTPLTSIINYINLLKEQKMPTQEAEHYIEVLDQKTQRLRHLTEDLVEAAKATSGNVELEMMPLAFDELMRQSIGEFEDKYSKKNLSLLATYPEGPVTILADGRRLFRVMENVLQNAYKYSLEGTRVYADLVCDGKVAAFTLKNISAAKLNISPEELMERFTRGDVARSTEGSGLGLSIAKDLVRLQGGTFEIQLDGDLFKIVITFPQYISQDT